jgi:dephospho-CoA kinase
MEEIGRHKRHAIAIVEAALILEAGAGNRFDRLIVVTCREAQRVERFAERRHISIEAARREVLRRMAAQLPDEEKIKSADYVIDNSGALDATKKQVSQVYQHLREEALRTA